MALWGALTHVLGIIEPSVGPADDSAGRQSDPNAVAVQRIRTNHWHPIVQAQAQPPTSTTIPSVSRPPATPPRDTSKARAKHRSVSTWHDRHTDS